ncbi:MULTISPECIES: hypothetical protein [Achromobacter]|uniref:Uncharacterized protein n=1 Tax=Achromobacter spanius TaxID=217203 RepID=A0ABY8GXR7_9BURK|nr:MULTISPECIES: hypothetical protein [Achromobacter]WAI81091.1 hypothetical protein N8Z00_16200 [Achromobacter spanius]WEX96609.1 hypothetical protein N3Z32_10805 [Achromobacter sp. SS2-2022]WFP09675.1 hypothetical protein P8T11_07305 [Achromobacter spanius]
MVRSSHPKKEIESVLRHAEQQGWRVRLGSGHAWGRIYCPYNDHDCRRGEFCIASVWSTPRNADSHARLLRRVLNQCTAHLEQTRTLSRREP